MEEARLSNVHLVHLFKDGFLGICNEILTNEWLRIHLALLYSQTEIAVEILATKFAKSNIFRSSRFQRGNFLQKQISTQTSQNSTEVISVGSQWEGIKASSNDQLISNEYACDGAQIPDLSSNIVHTENESNSDSSAGREENYLFDLLTPPLTPTPHIMDQMQANELYALPATRRDRIDAFANAPVGNKLATEIPGAEHYEKILNKWQIIYAYQLIGEYLLMKCHRLYFINFLKTKMKMNMIDACEVHDAITLRIWKTGLMNVKKIRGISRHYLERLTINGYKNMTMVIGVYLILAKDDRMMLNFFCTTAGLKGPLTKLATEAIDDMVKIVSEL